MTGLLKKHLGKSRLIKDIRNKGLFIGVELKENLEYDGGDVVNMLLDYKILCKQTQKNIIRMAPPLTIDEKSVYRISDTFKRIFEEIEWLNN